jgi:hypothetical protein
VIVIVISFLDAMIAMMIVVALIETDETDAAAATTEDVVVVVMIVNTEEAVTVTATAMVEIGIETEIENRSNPAVVHHPLRKRNQLLI